MGTKETARAEVRASMRSGWSLEAQRSYYQRMLERAQALRQAVDDVQAEAEAAAPSRGTDG